MDDHKIVFWFLISSGVAAAAVAVFFGKLVNLYYVGRSGRPSDTALLAERLLAAFVAGVAFALATRGQF